MRTDENLHANTLLDKEGRKNEPSFAIEAFSSESLDVPVYMKLFLGSFFFYLFSVRFVFGLATLCFLLHRKGIKHKMCCGDGEEPDRPPSCRGQPGQRRLTVRITGSGILCVASAAGFCVQRLSHCVIILGCQHQFDHSCY